MKLKRLCLFGIAAVLTFGQICQVGATPSTPEIEQARREKAETTSQLGALRNSIDDLEAKKAEVAGEIDSLNGQLVTTIAEINSLKKQIKEKTAQIEKTGEELKAAEAQKELEYEAMKKRIQYIYEQGGRGGWSEIFLNQGSISQVLTKAEYTQKMYNYDRECLTAYIATVNKVTELKAKQEEEKENLIGLKEDEETNQQNLEVLLEQAKQESENYEAQLADANRRAVQYQKLIEEQTRKIDQLVAAEEARRAAEEARRKAAEAARKAKEEAARKKKAEEEARRRAEEEAEEDDDEDEDEEDEDAEEIRDDDSDSHESSHSSHSSDEDDDDDEDSDSDDEDDSDSDDSDDDEDDSDDSDDEEDEEEEEEEEEEHTSSGNSSKGQSIVNYACQFIGNRYVWGGTSLTNGCDCSGFVMQVYAHFGYSLPHSSASMRSCGRSVGSLSNAQPGDILCYSGHVAIYMGGGQMVNASNSAPYPRGGIKTGSASYRSIITIRRLV